MPFASTPPPALAIQGVKMSGHWHPMRLGCQLTSAAQHWHRCIISLSDVVQTMRQCSYAVLAHRTATYITWTPCTGHFDLWRWGRWVWDDVLMKAADLFEGTLGLPLPTWHLPRGRCTAHGSTAGWTRGPRGHSHGFVHVPIWRHECRHVVVTWLALNTMSMWNLSSGMHCKLLNLSLWPATPVWYYAHCLSNVPLFPEALWVSCAPIFPVPSALGPGKRWGPSLLSLGIPLSPKAQAGHLDHKCQ